MSTNGGSNWVEKDTGYFGSGYDIMIDPNNNSVYWSCGDYNSAMAVSKTTNSGTSWIRYPIGTGSGDTYCLAVDPSNSNIVYAGGIENSAGVIYKTTNAGSNWSKLTATGLSGYVYDIAFDLVDTDILYAGTESGVFKSTNGGNNWSNTGFSGGRTNQVLINPDNGDIYAGTNSNGVYISTDDGSTWLQQNDGLDNLTILRLGINPGDYLFAGTSGNGFYRWNLTVGIEEENFETKSVFYAKPNPFETKTTINFQLSKEAFVNLSIYDVQGRLVRVIKNGVESAGNHSTVWFGLNDKNMKVASGVYFYKLTIDDQAHMQKLILVK